MRQMIRLFLLVEGVSFVVASLFHFGLVIAGYAHRQAAIAESTIGVVLLAGLALTFALPARTRVVGIVAQGFALAGTLVGVFTILAGFGPRTVPDVVYHLTIVLVLTCGLVAAIGTPGSTSAAEAVHEAVHTERSATS